MPRMVCVKCGLFFHIKKNGVNVEEGKPHGIPIVQDGWSAYKIWKADLWQCKGCGTEVVAGFGLNPILEHFMTNYQKFKAENPIFIFVKDCL